MRLPKAFWLLWFGQAFNRIGTLAPAFLVLYLEQDHLVDSRTTPLIVGLFGAGVVTSGLIGGALADAIGPRRTIIAAQPVAAATALLYLATTNMAALCLLALATGFLSAVDRPAGAGMISKIVPQEDFSRAYSLYLVGFNVGMSLGPVLSGLLLSFYPPALFIVWAACSGIYAALVCALPADAVRPAAERREGGSVLRSAARGITEPFRVPVLVVFLALTFLMACVYLQVNSTLPLGMREEGLDPGEIGLVLAVNAVLSVVLLPLVPRVVGGMREEIPLMLASGFIAVGFGLNVLAHGIPMFIVATVVWTIGEVLWAPISATFIAKRAPEGRVSTFQGSFFFAWNAAFVVGGPAGIALAKSAGYPALWLAALALGLAVALGFKSLTRISGFRVPEGPDALMEETAAPDKVPAAS
ncbi:MFS family permease [Streptomyces olivoverticillatus]|uniref:MFS family permease n=1 Tax=Streptomyces olivoverticillatus TaxID=66427 RepID=A0A7W7PM81_9ACTN|nr:MFS transporter [Streptomyces olivoverticillatus]MBB4894228.1 MFS family permease [Streptomyces olivoverticillatus]